MKRYVYFVILSSYFSFSSAQKEIVVPQILGNSALYAGAITATAAYYAFRTHIDNKSAENRNNQIESAIQNSVEEERKREEITQERIRVFKNVLWRNESDWILIGGKDDPGRKISVLKELYNMVKDVLRDPDILKNAQYNEVNELFCHEDEDGDNARFAGKDLNQIHAKLIALITKKLARMSKPNNDIYKRDTKVVFGYRGYGSLLPLFLLSGFFWLPTCLKMFGYVISIGGDQVRRSFPFELYFEEFLLPKWFGDVRTYAALFALLSVLDGRRIFVKNQEIRERNLEAIENKALKCGYLQNWYAFNKNILNEEGRKKQKTLQIITLYNGYAEKDVYRLFPKDIVVFSDGEIQEFPSLNFLERVLRNSRTLKDMVARLDSQFSEEDLLSLHSLMLARFDCEERPLVSYGRPFNFAVVALNLSLFYALSRYNVVKFSFDTSRRFNF